MRLRGFKSVLSMRTEWIVILTLYSIALPILTGWAALRIVRGTVQADTFSGLTGVSANLQKSIENAVHDRHDHVSVALKLINSACGASGALNEDCVIEELRALRASGAEGAALRYMRRRGSRTISLGRVQPNCAADTCISQESRSRGLSVYVTQHSEESGLWLTASWPLRDLLLTNLQLGQSAAVIQVGNRLEPLGRSDLLSIIPQSELKACAVDQRGTSAADSLSYRVLQPVPSLKGVCGVAYVPASTVLDERRVKRALMRVALAFVAVSIVLALIISLATTRAVRELRDRMRSLKVGGEVAPVRHRGPAELAELSAAFDSMASSLRSSQQALLESERKLSMAYRAAKMWVWEHDLRNGTVVIRNPSADQPNTATTLHGILRDVHPDDRHKVLAAMRITLQTGVYAAEYRVRRDGEYLWASSWGELVEGESLLIGVTADVTTIKEGERFRSERERLLATTEMSGSLAHEINNPLTAVTGSLYMAQESAPGNEEVQHYLQIASVETRRIAEIVRRLLQLHRTTSSPTTFDVAKLWRDLVAASNDLKRKGVSVRVHTRGSAQVVGYIDELRNGFSNLLRNAITSATKEGEISVRLRPSYSLRSGVRGVRILLCSPDASYQTADNVQKLFRPFARTKAGDDVGLDLWITKAAVLKQGGYLQVRTFSGPQSLTCLRIFLPNRPEDQPNA